MLAMNLLTMGAVLVAGLTGAVAIYYILHAFTQRSLQSAPPIGIALGAPTFLFDDKYLIDATRNAQSLIKEHLPNCSHFDAMVKIFAPRFPTLKEEISALPDDRRLKITTPESDGPWLDISRTGGLTRVILRGGSLADDQILTDIISHDTQSAELSLLKEITQNTPQMIWLEDSLGVLTWANNAYLDFSDRINEASDHNAIWPSKSIFPELAPTATNAPNGTQRLSVEMVEKGTKHWFDVTSVPREDGILHFASEANAIVRAEVAQRDFMQTLSNTFAQLSTGLAIFDKRRRLVTFNPALLELTDLPFDFLSARPSVDMFLDRMRETQMLPEPKDYTTWRDQFTALEVAAKNGTYCDNWSLPDGQTYRVTGRPHPDGAIALLFEDISAEVSLTRRFRADIETGQAVLDSFSEAVVVFSNSGTLVMNNNAYAELWGRAGDQMMDRHDLRTELRLWQNHCTPSPLWSKLRKFSGHPCDRVDVRGSVILEDGRHISCLATPISGGMTLIKFSVETKSLPVVQKLLQADPAIHATKL